MPSAVKACAVRSDLHSRAGSFQRLRAAMQRLPLLGCHVPLQALHDAVSPDNTRQ